MPWPVDALERVAEYFISSMKLGQAQEQAEAGAAEQASVDTAESDDKKSDNVEEIVLSELELELVQIVMYFNNSVFEASER